MNPSSTETEVRTYRKKPVEVQAMRWFGDVTDSRHRPQPPPELRRFAGYNVVMVQVGSKTHGGPDEFLPAIRTREGAMVLRSGDWLVRGTRGEFYPCKPDAFDDTFEVVTDANATPEPVTYGPSHSVDQEPST